MIRMLVITAVSSFVLSAVCFAGSMSIAGGPIWIDDHRTYHVGHWSDQGARKPDIGLRTPQGG